MPTLIQRGRLAEKYEGLLLPIARGLKQTLPASIDIEDLVLEGRKGLWQATAKFTRKQAATFAFYVRTRIKGAMIDSIKGKRYREATHLELPTVMQITDYRPSVEQQMITCEEAAAAAADRCDKLRRIALAIADPDPKFQPISTKQKKVIELRYRRGMTQTAAGAVMGITQQSLQQIESRTLRSLRRKIAA